MKSYRYPGSRPFTSHEQNLFFGRDTHIEELKKTIRLNKITVLYSPSGLGKSSLIEAGLVPQIQEKYAIIPVRFNNYLDKKSPLPLKTFERRIDEQSLDLTIFDKIESEHVSIWQKLKSIQQNLDSEQKILFVFDQFEELFTYPKGVEEFSTILSELLSNKMPKAFSEKLETLVEEDADILSDKEWENLNRDLDLRVIVSIRSDRLSLLDRISQHISIILNNLYELTPLSEVHAREAIVLPAQMEGEQFNTPAFTYEEEAIEQLIIYLSKNHTEPIESFQLQILCQHIEENLAHFGEAPKEAEDSWIIKAEKLPKLEVISQNYYEEQLRKIDSEEGRRQAELLIEEGLILEEEERRISLDEGHIRALYDVDGDLLDKLVTTHIVRREPNSLGGFSYELSHDTLVAPILATKKFREAKERELLQRQEAEERARAEQAAKEEKLRQRLRKTSWVALIVIAILSAIFGSTFYVQYQKSLIVNQKLSEYNENLRDAYASLSQFVRVDTTATGDSLGLVVVVQSRRALEIIKGFNRNIAIYDSLTRDLQMGLEDRNMDRKEMIARIEAAKQQINDYQNRFINLVKKPSLDAILILEDADSAFQEKDYVRAIKLYETVKDLDPENKAATEGIEACKQKQREGMIAELLEEVQILLEAGKEIEAREKLDKILELDETNEGALAILEELEEKENLISENPTLPNYNQGSARSSDQSQARSASIERDSVFLYTDVLAPNINAKERAGTKAEKAHVVELNKWMREANSLFSKNQFFYAQQIYDDVRSSEAVAFSSTTPSTLVARRTQLISLADERYQQCEQGILAYSKFNAISAYKSAKSRATSLLDQSKFKAAVKHWYVTYRAATYLAKKFDYEEAIKSLPEIKDKLRLSRLYTLSIEGRMQKNNGRWKAAVATLSKAEKLERKTDGSKRMKEEIMHDLDSMLNRADNLFKRINDYLEKTNFNLTAEKRLKLVKKGYQTIEDRYTDYEHAAERIDDIDETLITNYDELATTAFFRENWRMARRHYSEMRKIDSRDERTKTVAQLILDKINSLKAEGDSTYKLEEYIITGRIYKQVLQLNPSDRGGRQMMRNLKKQTDPLLDPLFEELYQFYLAKDAANIRLKTKEIDTYKEVNNSILQRRSAIGDRLMSQVNDLFTKKQLEEAETFYQSILPLKPQGPEIESYASKWLDGVATSFKAGKYAEARTTFQEIERFAMFSNKHNKELNLGSYVFEQSANTFDALLDYCIELYEKRDFSKAEATYYNAVKLFIRLNLIDGRSRRQPGYSYLMSLPKDQQNSAIFDLANEEIDVRKNLHEKYFVRIYPFYQRLWDNEAALSGTRAWSSSKSSYEAIMKIKPARFKYSDYFLFLNAEDESPFQFLEADAYYRGNKWTPARDAYKNLCQKAFRTENNNNGNNKKKKNKKDPPPSFDELYNKKDFKALRSRIIKLRINGSVRNYYRDTILKRLEELSKK